METSDYVIGGIALVALLVSIVEAIVQGRRSARRDEFEQRINSEMIQVMKRDLELQEEAHEWRRQDRQDPSDGDDSDDGAAATSWDDSERSDDFGNGQYDHQGGYRVPSEVSVRFAFRDSARTWGRVIATNSGTTDLRHVELDVFAEQRNGEVVRPEPIGGTDYRVAEVLKPSESVHVGYAFTFQSPGPEDLSYRVTWVDEHGQRKSATGQLPLGY